jgi:transglutaminase-like putative cysteine protease
MKYSKHGIGWGQGDVVWVCDSKYGNCSDFHSLFISLTRAQKIPAKFEMGFPIPEKRGEGVVGGYHCWAWFLPDGKGWVPVDISEANREPKMKEYYFGNLTENRVTFTTGRDIELVPRQAAGPLNFFIYPYAEIDGRPHADDGIERSFTYQDVNGK